jgi:hypothetical protein
MPTAKQNAPSAWSLKAVDPELLKLAVPVGRGGRSRWGDEECRRRRWSSSTTRHLGGEVLGRLNAIARHGATTFQQCQKGAHVGTGAALQGLINDVEQLAAAFRRQ